MTFDSLRTRISVMSVAIVGLTVAVLWSGSGGPIAVEDSGGPAPDANGVRRLARDSAGRDTARVSEPQSQSVHSRAAAQPDGTTHSSVSGRVVDNLAIPVHHANVILVTHSGETSCQTDREGRFVLALTWRHGRRVPSLTVLRTGFAPSQVQLDHDLLLQKPTEVRTRDIVLQRGKTFVGRAIATGIAPGAMVRAIPAHGVVPPPAWSDASGRFYLGVTPGSLVDLRISHARWGSARRLVRCTAGPGIEEIGDLHLIPTATVACNTTLLNGTPARGVKLTLRHAEIDFGSPEEVRCTGSVLAVAVTSSDGFFALHGLEPGTYHVECGGVVDRNHTKSIEVQTGNSIQALMLPYRVLMISTRHDGNALRQISKLSLSFTHQSRRGRRHRERTVRGIDRVLIPDSPGFWRIHAKLGSMQGRTDAFVPPGLDEIPVTIELTTRH